MSDRPVDLNLEELKELIKLLRESHVSEFEIRKADYRLRIRQGNPVEEYAAPVPSSLPANGQGLEGSETFVASLPPVPVEEKEPLHEVRSPIVGTFYRAASAEGTPFVEVGDTIRQGQVLCILEAMKIMNEIESDTEGVIRKIHALNGQPVEFGELLFSIKPVS